MAEIDHHRKTHGEVMTIVRLFEDLRRQVKTVRRQELLMKFGALRTRQGNVMQITGPLGIAFDFVREHVADPFRQLVAVGFNPKELVPFRRDIVPTVQVTVTTDLAIEEIPESVRHGVQLPHPDFRYVSLIAEMRDETSLIALGEGMQHREMVGLIARRLAGAVFDEKGVRGTRGLASALSLYAPTGPLALHAWHDRKSVMFPTHFATRGSRVMAIGRDVLVNGQIGSADLHLLTFQKIHAGLLNGEGVFGWRRADRLPMPVTDFAVELKRGMLPVLQTRMGENLRRYTFEYFHENRLDAIINDGPMLSGTTLQRLPEEIVPVVRSIPSRRRIRRSVSSRPQLSL